jgi:hypothetical protein
VQTVPVERADVEGWRRSVEALYPQIRERPDFDKPMFDELSATLGEYRKAHP